MIEAEQPSTRHPDTGTLVQFDKRTTRTRVRVDCKHGATAGRAPPLKRSATARVEDDRVVDRRACKVADLESTAPCAPARAVSIGECRPVRLTVAVWE